jgi:sec-independent protein translocase protein TatC
MPFLDHLEELRWRIIYSLAAITLGMLVGFYVTRHFHVLERVEAPILPYLNGHRVIATHPTDGLQFTISAAMWIGGVLAFPVVLYQAWSFLSPALYARERRLLIGALAAGIALFIAGAAFAFIVVLPMTLPFLFGLFGQALEPMVTGENYFDFVFGLVLSFGLAFELPVLVLLLSSAGLVTPEFLTRYRRHAIVVILVAAAIISPGDVATTTLALAVPLYLLYEISIAAARLVRRRRRSDDDSAALLLAPLLLVRARIARRATV